MFTALNVAGVQATIDSYGANYALWADDVIPQGFIGKSINFYRSEDISGATDYTIYQYTINCRADLRSTAEAIAEAVLTAINRVSFVGYYIVCSVLPVIPPADDRDNYNCIVQAILKKK